MELEVEALEREKHNQSQKAHYCKHIFKMDSQHLLKNTRFIGKSFLSPFFHSNLTRFSVRRKKNKTCTLISVRIVSPSAHLKNYY